MTLSGTISIPAAETPIPGPDEPGGEFFLAGHPDNTAPVRIGDSAGVSQGYALPPGQPVTLRVANLSSIWFTSSQAGARVCWLKVW